MWFWTFSLDLLQTPVLFCNLPWKIKYAEDTYNNGDLNACFDKNIPDSVIKAIAKRKPLRAVFRDSSFAGSPEKINVGEILSCCLRIQE